MIKANQKSEKKKKCCWIFIFVIFNNIIKWIVKIVKSIDSILKNSIKCWSISRRIFNSNLMNFKKNSLQLSVWWRKMRRKSKFLNKRKMPIIKKNNINDISFNHLMYIGNLHWLLSVEWGQSIRYSSPGTL